MKKILLLLLPLLMLITFPASASDWEWQNPYPQGNDLYDVHFVDYNSGWAVGNLGTILSTTDGGENWIVHESGTLDSLKTVYFKDENEGWIGGSNGTLMHTVNGGESWKNEDAGTQQTLNDLIMYEERIWIAADNGTLIYSDDNGKNWIPKETGLSGDLQSLFFNKESGWVVGTNDAIATTTDNGQTWRKLGIQYGVPQNSFLYGVYSFNKDQCFVAGNFVDDDVKIGGLYGTTNGGNGWDYMDGTHSQQHGYYDVVFTDSLNGWICAEWGTIFHSSDGGLSWTEQDTGIGWGDKSYDYHINPLYSLHFADAQIGWAVGYEGNILKTSNGGQSWESQNQIPDGIECSLHRVFFLDAQTGWAVGGFRKGYYVHTKDGGTNWEQREFTNRLHDITFTDKDNGWLIEGKGLIHKSDDLGENWVLQHDEKSDLKALSFIDNQTGWVCGDSGRVVQTTDGGTTWQDRSVETDKHLEDIFFTDKNNGWTVASWGTIYNTVDGGLNWQLQLQDSVNYNHLESVVFIDSLTGWTAGCREAIYNTTDGGQHWIKQHTSTDRSGCWLQDIFFVDHQHGWAVGYTGFEPKNIFYTVDGGEHWYQKPRETQHSLFGVYFTDSQTGWVVGGNGTVMKTITGGGNSIDEESENGEIIPKVCDLFQNYPNPFNPQTTIKFALPEASAVKVNIYNARGGKIAEVVNGYKKAGYHTVEFDGSKFTSGLYFYSLEVAGAIISKKKMMLIK